MEPFSEKEKSRLVSAAIWIAIVIMLSIFANFLWNQHK